MYVNPSRAAEAGFKKALEELWEICHQLSVVQLLASKAKREGVVRWLGDPYVSPDGFNVASEELGLAMRLKKGPAAGAYRAALGLFCFFAKAEDFARRGNDPVKARPTRDEADRYLEDPEAVELLNGLCDMRDPYCTRPAGETRLHKTGSTSVILDATVGGSHCALKVVKPVFMDNPTIRRATRDYVQEFRLVDGTYAPKVLTGNERLIVMEFVPGETLTECCRSTLWNPERQAEERIRLVLEAIYSIIAALKHHYNEHGKNHLDLSPDNVIVAGERPLKVKLVDFGVNHVLRSGAYMRGDIEQLLAYVSPEVRDGGEASVRSDIYSLGAMVLELFYGRRLKRGQMPDALDDMADRYPMLAKLLEQLVSGTPGQRLPDVEDTRGIYDRLMVRLQEEAKYIGKEPGLSWAASAIFAWSSNVDVNVASTMRKFSPEALWKKDARESDYLFSWRVVSLILLAVSVGIASAWMIWWCPAKIWSTGWASALSAFLVATSTMLVAGRYYNSIFGQVTARSISKWTDFWLRANAVGSLLLLLMFLPLHIAGRPLYTLWAFMIFPTTALVIVNNYSCWRLAKRIAIEGPVKSDLGAESMQVLGRWPAEFGPWWGLMVAFLFGVLWVGVGLSLWSSNVPPSGWWSTLIPRDELTYAVVISAINWKMFLLNCGKDAHKVRANLARLFWASERSLYVRRVHRS
jgi:serine/threonine protein kinase